ncbi:hypothetical protein [uncultured Legionella sp.]|uniref:hypothetical protein n=1 Tax=uncultured Legionella sp. TaxID=210934 RepID=UPI00261028A3|nr:hypothetical protein [uncultured Legionella sp.]
MFYASKNAAFRRDKHQFFAQVTTSGETDSKIQFIEERVDTIGYTFLLENQQILETEFAEMFTVLQKQDDENKEAFWLYCYYCASLLEAFHKAYLQPGKEADYAAIKQQIKDRLQNKVKQNESDVSFIESLYNSFLTGFSNLTKSPWHLSQIRDYVAYANLCRIYWAFCRMTMTQGFTLAKELQLIEQLDALLGTHTDVNQIISAFQIPTRVINFFSVGFFLVRFMIDGGLLLRHTFFPTELEKGAANGCEISKMNYLPGAASIDGYRNTYALVQEDEGSEAELYYIPRSGKPIKLNAKDKNKLQFDLTRCLGEQESIRLTADEVKEFITAQTEHAPEVTTAYDRFKHDLYKRHCNFANDLVWAVVNGLSNFNNLFHISGPVAGYLTAVFLTFDVCLTLYKCNLAKQEYLTKKSQYLSEIDDYNNPDMFKKMSAEQKLMHIDMLNKQLIELEINWKTKEATFYFIAAAAALLMMGFTTAILVSSPFVALAAFCVCTIAVAMYLSIGTYSTYKEKEYNYEQAQLTGKNLAVTHKEFDTARDDFIFTMAKNAIVPTVLISTFAICWPAAVVLTALYLGAELYHSSSKHSEDLAAKQLALAAPDEEVEKNNCWPFSI